MRNPLPPSPTTYNGWDLWAEVNARDTVSALLILIVIPRAPLWWFASLFTIMWNKIDLTSVVDSIGLVES